MHPSIMAASSNEYVVVALSVLYVVATTLPDTEHMYRTAKIYTVLHLFKFFNRSGSWCLAILKNIKYKHWNF